MTKEQQKLIDYIDQQQQTLQKSENRVYKLTPKEQKTDDNRTLFFFIKGQQESLKAVKDEIIRMAKNELAIEYNK